MSTPVAPQQEPQTPGDQARSFLLWAFAISIVLHFGFGGLIPKKPYTQKDQEVEKVSMTRKIKVVVPPPKPTPPPPTPPPPKSTPPPKTPTNPPPQPRLK